MSLDWTLPKNDPWSTPFADSLLHHLELAPDLKVLDIAAGGGIPAFHIADKIGPQGHVLAIDINPHQILRARSTQQGRMPWLKFEVADMKQLPPGFSRFDRITGNLSFMFFRPNRPEALQQLLDFLNPGGQIVLTFPSLGTFDSLWDQVRLRMKAQGHMKELERFEEYFEERPSAQHARQWLAELGMEKIDVTEWPLEIPTGRGRQFLEHPLLRGGFLDDVYECFEDPSLAETFMTELSADTESFTPLHAIRCAMSGWKPA
ncbi:MAG: class I SAM-dependent methyltransferase [Candidatus Nitrohelix vancouverensis]|uniref:Class I SAM-dependent methyltransferase n=1 Tax=Candidatus Nitrohelix vancouverensis TaxID=2705534 RepID=A0A7T0G2E4_9BACT|nr:MAG: class I SAM-dependent methyltransferase [Candidatus Nitrohelix vancouverensis]